MAEPITEVWAVVDETGHVDFVRETEDLAQAMCCMAGHRVQRLALATPEMVANAERWRYVRDHAQWHRRTEVVGWAMSEPITEEQTFMMVRMPNGANLSCAAMYDHAIDAARAGEVTP